MLTPSILIAPAVTRAWSTRSFIRLKHRRSVDLPQPDGPMNAVTFFSGIFRLIPCSALDLPYLKSTLSTSMIVRVTSEAGTFISEATISEEMVVFSSTVSGLVSVDLARSIIRDRFSPIESHHVCSRASAPWQDRFTRKKARWIRPSSFQFCRTEDSSELHEKVRLENHVLAIP